MHSSHTSPWYQASYRRPGAPKVSVLVHNMYPFCETQRFTDQKLSSPIFACRLSVRIGDISTYLNYMMFLDHTNHTWCMCGGI